jgi:hypothetical protein
MKVNELFDSSAGRQAVNDPHICYTRIGLDLLNKDKRGLIELYKSEQFSDFVKPVGRYYQRFRLKVNGQWYERPVSEFNPRTEESSVVLVKDFSLSNVMALQVELIDGKKFVNAWNRGKFRGKKKGVLSDGIDQDPVVKRTSTVVFEDETTLSTYARDSEFEA